MSCCGTTASARLVGTAGDGDQREQRSEPDSAQHQPPRAAHVEEP
jgi:hypothetical protein